MTGEKNLLGRLAIHYKLLTAEQLAETTLAQSRDLNPKPLGEYWILAGHVTRAQLDKLLAVQKDVLAQQAKPAAAAAPAAAPAQGPAGPAPDLDETGVSQLARRIERVLGYAVAQRASDIHVLTGEKLLLRIDGERRPVGETTFGEDQVDVLCRELLSADDLALLERDGQVDFAFTLAGQARFRGNAYRHQNGKAIALRAIPLEIPTLGSLGLPNSLAKLTNHHQGLVLLTGPAGCGKSSTLAALLHLINTERRDHIITVEDPIEYLHKPILSVVNQRQVLRDTGSFARALKAALREDPDVIAIGELRDLETISLALTAAETGHLVLATLHTGSSIRTIDRIVGSFPASQQSQIRTMFSESLRAVVSQRLVRRADGPGRVPAIEVLLGTRAVSNLIREMKTFQIRSILQMGASSGMGLLDASLAELVKARTVTREEALVHAEDPKLIPGGAA